MAPGRDLVATDAGTVAATQDYLHACVDLAAAVGAARGLRAVLRRDRAGLADGSDDERDAAYASCATHLAPVVEHAAARGVRIGIEPLNRYETSLVNTVDQALTGLGPLLGPSLGLALDTYHLNIEERSSADAVRRGRRAPRAPPGLRQRPRRARRRPDRLAGAARRARRRRLRRRRWPSRASRPTTPRSPSPPRSGGRWPPHPTTWPATAWRFLRGPLHRIGMSHRRRRRRLGVAVVGYSFMGKAHSNAWRNVGAFHPECPPVRQQVLVGRDPSAVKEAADRYGWAESATDWRSGHRARRHRHRRHLHPGPPAPRDRPRGAGGRQARAGREAAGQQPGRGRGDGRRGGRAPRGAACWSMVGFNYRRVPALALARELIADGRIGDGPPGAGGVPPGLAGRRVRPDDLAAAQGDRRLGRARRPRLARGRPGAVPARLAGDVGERAPAHVRHRPRPGDGGPEPVTVDDAAWAHARLPRPARWPASRSAGWRPAARTA